MGSSRRERRQALEMSTRSGCNGRIRNAQVTERSINSKFKTEKELRVGERECRTYVPSGRTSFEVEMLIFAFRVLIL